MQENGGHFLSMTLCIMGRCSLHRPFLLQPDCCRDALIGLAKLKTIMEWRFLCTKNSPQGHL